MTARPARRADGTTMTIDQLTEEATGSLAESLTGAAYAQFALLTPGPLDRVAAHTRDAIAAATTPDPAATAAEPGGPRLGVSGIPDGWDAGEEDTGGDPPFDDPATALDQAWPPPDPAWIAEPADDAPAPAGAVAALEATIAQLRDELAAATSRAEHAEAYALSLAPAPIGPRLAAALPVDRRGEPAAPRLAAD